MIPTLSIIGAGRAGKSLARLWHDARSLRVLQVLNRSLESASAAVEFIGAGTPIGEPHELRSADYFMVSTPDASIESAAELLAASGRLTGEATVFHLSGALPASALDAAAGAGARCAALHPVKSFADPELAIHAFEGTPCGVEGDTQAVAALSDLVRAIGGRPFALEAATKPFYHAGSALVSNCLVALVECGLRCFENAGLDRSAAMALVRSLAEGTLSNLRQLGTTRALTGPIARGDAAVVSAHLRALDAAGPLLDVYKALGRVALELSTLQGTARAEDLEQLRALLRTEPTHTK